MSRAEAIVYLKQQVFKDAVAAGWLKECARKKGEGKDSVFFRTVDCEAVSRRIAEGDYPEPLSENPTPQQKAA